MNRAAERGRARSESNMQESSSCNSTCERDTSCEEFPCTQGAASVSAVNYPRTLYKGTYTEVIVSECYKWTGQMYKCHKESAERLALYREECGLAAEALGSQTTSECTSPILSSHTPTPTTSVYTVYIIPFNIPHKFLCVRDTGYGYSEMQQE